MTENTAGRPGNRRRWAHLVVVGLLLPLVAAAVLVWSVSNRQDKLDPIPVAVVNNDKILTDPQPMAAGRALSASLTDPKPGATKLDWTLTGTKDATDGLEERGLLRGPHDPVGLLQRDHLLRHGQARAGTGPAGQQLGG